VRFPGRWIVLASANWYSSGKPLNTLEDLRGLRIRNAGGFAQSWHAKFFGATPISMNWTDVPLALSQCAIDALQRRHESCVSARLWDSGLRHALVDHQSVAAYIPMISEAFWLSLTPALRTLVIDLWAANIGDYRTDLATAQEQAEQSLKARGVTVSYVAANEISAQHRRMMAEQSRAMNEMKMPPTILACVTDALAAIN